MLKKIKYRGENIALTYIVLVLGLVHEVWEVPLATLEAERSRELGQSHGEVVERVHQTHAQLAVDVCAHDLRPLVDGLELYTIPDHVAHEEVYIIALFICNSK